MAPALLDQLTDSGLDLLLEPEPLSPSTTPALLDQLGASHSSLTYATDMNCFLLKEAAINFIMANANEVLATLLMKRTNVSEDLSQLSINCLRAELDLLESDIDGSRDLLIARLKKWNKF